MRRYNPKQSQVSFLYLPNTPNLPAVTSTFLYINVCKEKISILLNTQGIVMIQSNKAPTSQHTYWDTSAASVAKNVCSCLAKLTMEAEVGMLGGPAGLKKAGNCKPPLHAHNPVSRLPWACSRLVDTCTRDGAVSGTFQAKILEESDPSTAKKNYMPCSFKTYHSVMCAGACAVTYFNSPHLVFKYFGWNISPNDFEPRMTHYRRATRWRFSSESRCIITLPWTRSLQTRKVNATQPSCALMRCSPFSEILLDAELQKLLLYHLNRHLEMDERLPWWSLFRRGRKKIVFVEGSVYMSLELFQSP